MTDDWSSLWQKWQQQWSASGVKGAGDPLAQAVENFRQFAAAVIAAMPAAVGPEAPGGLASFFERLADTMATGSERPQTTAWFELPFLSASSFLAGPWHDVVAQGGSQWGKWASEMLTLPVLGPQREWHEAVRAVQRGLLAQQQAYEKLQAHHRSAAAMALRRFAMSLRDDDAQAITSLRELYDCWIDVAEGAYRETVMDEAYSRSFAEWINAWSRARSAGNALQERLAQSSNAPQRSEINAVLERQAALREEIASLQQQLAATRNSQATAPELVNPERKPASSEKTPRPARKPASAVKAPRPARATPKRKRSPASPRKSADAAGEFDISSILKQTD